MDTVADEEPARHRYQRPDPFGLAAALLATSAIVAILSLVAAAIVWPAVGPVASVAVAMVGSVAGGRARACRHGHAKAHDDDPRDQLDVAACSPGPPSSAVRDGGGPATA